MKTIPFLEDLVFGSEILFCPRGIINKPTVPCDIWWHFGYPPPPLSFTYCLIGPKDNSSQEMSIIVVGGEFGSFVAPVELLDPSANEWRRGNIICQSNLT